MNKFFKILNLIFLIFFLYSCGSVGETLQGKKRSDQGDEFLINKKNPLAMPPDFDKLPKPGMETAKSYKASQEEKSDIKNLLKNIENNQTSSSNEQSTSVENSILKKIK